MVLCPPSAIGAGDQVTVSGVPDEPGLPILAVATVLVQPICSTVGTSTGTWFTFTQKGFEKIVPEQVEIIARKQLLLVSGAVTKEFVTPPATLVHGPVPEDPDCHWILPVKLDSTSIVGKPVQTIAGTAEALPTPGGLSPVVMGITPLTVQQPNFPPVTTTE